MAGLPKNVLPQGTLRSEVPRLSGLFDDHLGEVALGGSTTFGRGPDNTVSLSDRQLSKRHCSIEQRGESYLLADADSSNGTFVNGRKVRELRLSGGDELSLGAHRVTFSDGRTTLDQVIVVDGQVGLQATVGVHLGATRLAEPPLTAPLAGEVQDLEQGLERAAGPAAVMDLAVQAAHRLTGADWASLSLRSAKGNLVARATAPRGVAAAQQVAAADLAELVRRVGRTLRCDDLQATIALGGPTALSPLLLPATPGLCAVVATPLADGGQVLGVLLAATDDRPTAFDDQQLSLIWRLAAITVDRLPRLTDADFWK